MADTTTPESGSSSNTGENARQQNHSNQGNRNGRPQKSDGASPFRSRTAPLSPSELQEIADVTQRVPALGRMVLALIRNRSARIVVPETALGREMFEVVGELDRINSRATTLLTRNLSAEKMNIKAGFDMRGVQLIEPLAQLTAEMADQFDHPTNPIVRHSVTKRLLHDLREARKPKKQPAHDAAAAKSEEGYAATA